MNAGIMLNEVPFANFPLIMKRAGMDFMILDTEHGGFDYSAMAAIIMGARQSGISIIVRLADNSRKEITKIMDMGADGLLLPMTECTEDIRQVVRFAKYAPEGQRGISTSRGHSFYQVDDLKQYMRETNRHTMVFAQIESAQGLAALSEILAAEGVAGVFLGPNDLACSLNCIGEKEPILEAIAAVGSEVRKAGKRAGIITETEAFLQAATESGFDLLCSGSEISLWKTGARRTAENLHRMGGNKI